MVAGWLLVAGCAGPLPAKPPQTSSPSLRVPRAAAECVSAPAPSREERPNRCLPNGLPKMADEQEIVPGETCVDHEPLARRWAQKLAKSYQRVANGRVDVSFQCDPLTADLSEIVVESGYGHGGSLQIWRLTRQSESTPSFDVIGVAHPTYYAQDKDSTLPLIARGEIASRDLEKALASVRVLLTASIREVEPPPKPGTIGLHSMFFSSGDFHHHFRLRDDGQHELAGGFTGYPNSQAQRAYVAIQQAMKELDPWLDRLSFQRAQPDSQLRKWFSAYFTSAWPRVQSGDAWWVRERMLNLAGQLGDASVIPIVAGELGRQLRRVREAPADKRVELAGRHLAEPLAALKALTGWDPREADDGSERPLMAAVELAVSECSRGAW